jgi:hypothetical protein
MRYRANGDDHGCGCPCSDLPVL